MLNLNRQSALAALAVLVAGSAQGQSTCLDTVFRDSFEALAQNRYEVELVVSQLGARSASFQLDGAETIVANEDGRYCFTEQVQGGATYEVSITEQPASGTVCGGDLTGVATVPISIAISCNFSRTDWNQFDWDQANWN